MAEKIIVLTGTSSGIGKELAGLLAAQGHQLVLAARREPELKALAKAVGGLAVVTDVTRREDVERLRDTALETHGRVEVWINNAGQGISRPVMDLSDEDLDSMMAVNVKSALYGMQAIIPHFMVRNSGHLINVSSFLARVPMASFRSAYSASKAALNSLTANLRMDLAESHPGVKVSLVMPGAVRTPFAQNAVGGDGQPLPASVPAQSVQEVAAAIAELVERPRAELLTNPAHAAAQLRYFQDVAAFEAAMRERA
jgi:short-subunit dehydrogenase